MANSKSDKKVLTLSEVKSLAEDKSRCILIINNRVYDVAPFLDEHPGGEEILKEQNGRNASTTFEDVGHSTDAREQMKKYEIAELHQTDAQEPVKPRPLVVDLSKNNAGTSWVKWVIPLLIVFAAVVYFRIMGKMD